MHEHSCGRCDALFSETPVTTARGNTICPACSVHYTSCHECDGVFRNVDLAHISSVDELVCNRCIRLHYTYCDWCSTLAPQRDFVTTPSGSSICDACYSNSYTCDECGNMVHCDDYGDEMCRNCEQEHRSIYKRGSMGGLRGTPTEKFPDRLIGVEIEYLHPRGEGAVDLRDWGTIKQDGSVYGDDCFGAEFASRPVSGTEAEHMLDVVTTKLNNAGCDVNSSCGLHIHVDVGDLTSTERRRVIQHWKHSEAFWFGMVDYTRRENDFCNPINGCDNEYLEDSRYNALNVSAYGKHGTFELRLHHGTLDKNEISAFASAAVHFIEAARHIEEPMTNVGNTRNEPSLTPYAQEFLDTYFSGAPPIISDGIKQKLRTFSHITL